MQPPADSSCTRGHITLAFLIGLLWMGSLLLFTFAHIAAVCASAGGASETFLLASSAMAAGAMVSGVLSDYIGRRLTARVMYGLGTMAASASIAAHPSDSAILMVLLGSAGIAAGGSHVAAELLLEAVPPKYRAFALVTYPALFFPVGLVQSIIQQAGWPIAVCVGSAIILSAMAGLLFLPESTRFQSSKAAAAAARRRLAITCALDASVPKRDAAAAAQSFVIEDDSAIAAATTPFGSPRGSATVGQGRSPESAAIWAIPGTPMEGDDHLHLLRHTDDAPPVGSPLSPLEHVSPMSSARLFSPMGGSDTTPAFQARSSVSICSSWATSCRSACNGRCRMLIPVLLCVLVTAAYWFSSLTFYTPDFGGRGDPSICELYNGKPDSSSAAGSMVEDMPSGTLRRALLFNFSLGDSAWDACSGDETGASSTSPSSFSGLHLALAEVVALLAVALLANSPRLGRRYTVSLAFAAAAVAQLIGAALLPSFGCSDSAGRTAVEFFVRASLAAAAQALLLYTLEVSSTASRSTAAGAFLALFRMGSLLTLANSLAPGAGARLQWAVYALEHPSGAWGVDSSSSSSDTSVSGGGASAGPSPALLATVLAICAQACILGALLALCLPVDTRLKALRDASSEPLVDAPADELVGSPSADLMATGRRLAASVVQQFSPRFRGRGRGRGVRGAKSTSSRRQRDGARLGSSHSRGGDEENGPPVRGLPTLPEYEFGWDPDAADFATPGATAGAGTPPSSNLQMVMPSNLQMVSPSSDGPDVDDDLASAGESTRLHSAAATAAAAAEREGGRRALAAAGGSPSGGLLAHLRAALPWLYRSSGSFGAAAPRSAAGGALPYERVNSFDSSASSHVGGMDGAHPSRPINSSSSSSSSSGSGMNRLEEGGHTRNPSWTSSNGSKRHTANGSKRREEDSGAGEHLSHLTDEAAAAVTAVAFAVETAASASELSGGQPPQLSHARSNSVSSVSSSVASLAAGTMEAWQEEIDATDAFSDPGAAEALADRLEAASLRLIHHYREQRAAGAGVGRPVASRRKAEFLHQEALRLKLMVRMASVRRAVPTSAAASAPAAAAAGDMLAGGIR